MAYIHVPKQLQNKLSACSLPCTFLGFAPNHSAFRLIHRPSRKFLKSYNVIFNKGGLTLCHKHIILEPNVTPPIPAPIPAPPPTVSPTSLHPKHTTCPPAPDNDPQYNLSSYGHCTNIVQADAPEPKTYAEAIASPDALTWLTMYKEEMRMFKNMDIYDIVPWPKGHKIIGSKWVFRIKWGPDSSIQKHKARIVAQGFMQVEGMDFDQTFTPIAKFSSLHTIFTLATEHDLKVHQIDIKATYLNAKLKKDLYMAASPGFDISEGYILKLKKRVYRTKQGS